MTQLEREEKLEGKRIVVYQIDRGRGPIVWTLFPTSGAEEGISNLRRNNAVILDSDAKEEKAIELSSQSGLAGDIYVATPCAIGDRPTDLYFNRSELR